MSEKVENVLERHGGDPLWQFGDHRTEAHEIAVMAAEMLDEDVTDLKFKPFADAIPCMTVVFLTELLNRLNRIKIETKAPVEFKFGKLMTLEIQYFEVKEAEKMGSLNPAIYVGPELDYDKADLPYDNTITADMARELAKIGGPHLPAQCYEDREFYQKICEAIKDELDKRYDIKYADWSVVVLATVYFFRAAKKFLIEHKDSGDIGVNLDLANIMTIGIVKEGPDDDVSYMIYLEPGQIFKKDNAKGDDITEADAFK